MLRALTAWLRQRAGRSAGVSPATRVSPGQAEDLAGSTWVPAEAGPLPSPPPSPPPTHSGDTTQRFTPAELAAAPDDDSGLAGQRLGAWQLQQRIGRGGMGEVWRARRADGLYEAQAAIKLLRSDLASLRLARRFDRERALLGRLNHPAIARLLDAGVDQGRAYLVLELVDGLTLSAHVRERQLSVAQRVQLLVHIAEAVDAAHARLVVHRDLKPGNVMVDSAGRPKLLDFGIAGMLDDDESEQAGELTRMTGRGLTLGYASPEQITGAGHIGTTTDVYALGVMLYELLSGTLPLHARGATRTAAEYAALHDEPRRLAASLAAPPDRQGPGQPPDAQRGLGDLEAIAAKAMRRDPAQRYGSVRALVDDLQRWQGHLPVQARRDDWRHRAGLWLRRNALPAGAAAAVLLALSAGLAASLWQRREAQQQARQAQAITGFLTEMLASANPSKHGGQWPTVLQLLDSSRAALPGRFTDDVPTRLRLLEVLTNTYNGLRRADASVALARQLVAETEAAHPASSRAALSARLMLAEALVLGDEFEEVKAVLQAIEAPVGREFGDVSDEHLGVLYLLSAAHLQTEQLDRADALLARAWAVSQRLRPADPVARALHGNELHVLRAKQGRLQDGHAELLQALAVLDPANPAHAPQWMQLQQNRLGTELDLLLHDGLEARLQQQISDAARVFGPGSRQAPRARGMLADYHRDRGALAQAAAVQQERLALARADAATPAPRLLQLQADLLLAQARAGQGERAARLQALRSLQARVLAGGPGTGPAATPAPASADLLLQLADAALADDDAPLAAQALQARAALFAPMPPSTTAAASAGAGAGAGAGAAAEPPYLALHRLASEGQLARLQGDLPRSAALLGQRLALLTGEPQPRPLARWQALLDLAFTQALAGDAALADTLAQAQRLRPAALPAGHPLDLALAWLVAQQPAASGAASAPAKPSAAGPAQAALAEALGRSPGWLAGSGGRGSLGGLLGV